MKMYEVEYSYKYGNGRKNAVRQVTELELNRMQQHTNKDDYYKNIVVRKELGEMDTTWIETWLKLGQKNIWIQDAVDPPFDEASFVECKTIDYLIDRLKVGNWSLGNAFYYKDLCFINQINAGDEWLAIRGDIDFDSVSCGLMIDRHGEEYFSQYIESILAATDEQLKTREYAASVS